MGELIIQYLLGPNYQSYETTIIKIYTKQQMLLPVTKCGKMPLERELKGELNVKNVPTEKNSKKERTWIQKKNVDSFRTKSPR